MPGIESITPASQGAIRVVGGHFYDNMLRDHYLPKVTEALNDPNTTWGQFESLDAVEFQGRFLNWRVHTGRNNGVNAVGQDAYLPDPGRQSYDKYRVPLRSVRGRIIIDPLLGETSKENVAAWVNSTSEEMRRLIGDMKRAMNRMVHGDGSGRIGEIGSISSAQATLATPDWIEGNGYWPSPDLTKFFVAGRRYAVINDADGTVRGVLTCASVDSTTQVTFDANLSTVSAAAGDWFVEVSRTGTTDVNDTAFAREIMGLAGMASDADLEASYYELEDASDAVHFQGTPSSNGDWNQAIVRDNGSAGRPLTEGVLNDADMQFHKANQKYPTRYCTSYEVAQAWFEMIADQRQYHQSTAKSPSFDGAIERLMWRGNPVIIDRDCFDHRIYAWCHETMGRTSAREWQWMDMDGSMMHRVSDKEQYQATMVWDGNLWTELRREVMVITNLVEG